MKRILFVLLGLLFTVPLLQAQKKELLVRTSDKGLYLEHFVVAKETYFGLGRLYNLHPRSIATFNGLDMDKGLNIGQKVRIPLLDTNFTQRGNTGTPVYYRIADKEGLSTVSRKHNNVSLASLRVWNNITGDLIRKDARLVIGFLRSPAFPVTTLGPSLPVEKAEPVVSDPRPELTPHEERKVAEEEKKAEEKLVKAGEKREDPPKQPVAEAEVRKPISDGQGYFRSAFDEQIKTRPVAAESTVTAGIFKTTSGWEDAKFYILIDQVPPGMIVRVLNPSNRKTVYAKVLGEMAGIRQNTGYQIRISNAAAAALEIGETEKFILQVQY